MNRKRSTTILATIAILVTLITPLFYIDFRASALSYTPDTATVSGVLSTDTYVLFPYQKQDLMIGFSKFGEMIDGNTKVGLSYNGEDAFAPHAGVVEWNWINGWILNVTYDEGGQYMNIWALALYSDYHNSSSIGGGWKEGVTGGSENLAFLGGRKTNGGAHTEPIDVLYDGPRRFVALLNTTIYEDIFHEIPLIRIIFTVVFDKDTKQVVLLKDIKRVDNQLKNIGNMEVEFGDRGEWDLGHVSTPPGGAPKSYAHIYTDKTTSYDGNYQAWYNTSYDNFQGTYDVCQLIDVPMQYAGWEAVWPKPLVMWVGGTQTEANRHIILTSMVTRTEVYGPVNGTWANFSIQYPNAITEEPWYNYSNPDNPITWKDDPMVFVDGNTQTEGVQWVWNESAKIVQFQQFYVPSAGSNVTIVYKWRGPKFGLPRADDMAVEPASPFVIGEWGFVMSSQGQIFRGVTIYGITNRNDGDDNDIGLHHTNVLDQEVQYFLDAEFNPYDLLQAVEKQDYRWVDISTLGDAASVYNLTRGLDDRIYYVNSTSELAELGMTYSDWTGYYFRARTFGPATDQAIGSWVNVYDDGRSYVYDKNWAANLTVVDTGTSTGGFPYVMLKVTPSPSYGNLDSTSGANHGFGPLGDETFKELTDFDFWYKMNATAGATHGGPNYGPHIEIKLAYNGTGNANNWVNLRADLNPVVNTYWTHYTLDKIANFIVSHNAGTAFWVTGIGSDNPKDSDGNAIPVGIGNAASYENWTSRLRDYKVLSVSIQLDRNLVSGASIAYVDDFSIGYLDRASGIDYERIYNMEEDKLYPCDWAAYSNTYIHDLNIPWGSCPPSNSPERVLVNGTLIARYGWENATNHEPYYKIDWLTGEITFYHYSSGAYVLWWLSAGTTVKVLYTTIEENQKGRYEWIVVGTPAATVDALSTAYVSQAFDSVKDIPVMEAGLDFRDTTWGPNMPYVMAGPGTRTRSDYVDHLDRPGLADDWCTTWPVASSDMIFMAGPRANLGTEYMNEFTNVFYPRDEFVVNNTLGQSDTIFGLTCWAHNIYTPGTPTADDGYGVISVYKDLNGTVGLVFWGMSAQDFYYTCQWFWSYPQGIFTPNEYGHKNTCIVYSGIEYLQQENCGVTDIILHIDYSTHTSDTPTGSYDFNCRHPEITIAHNERLGTISEKGQHDP